MGNILSGWFTTEPTLSFSLPFTFANPGTIGIVASPHSLPGLSKLPTWIFRSHFNHPGLLIAMGTHVAIHQEAADFCHPDGITPPAQGCIVEVVYLNTDWLAFRINEPLSGATHWLALPKKVVRLSAWQQFRGWLAGLRAPGTPFPLPPILPKPTITQTISSAPALSTATLLSSQTSLSSGEKQDNILASQVDATDTAALTINILQALQHTRPYLASRSSSPPTLIP